MENEQSKLYPTNYYHTFDRLKRQELLLAHQADDLQNIDDRIRVELWNVRYKKRGKFPAETDFFVKGFLSLTMEAKITVNFLNRKQELAHMKTAMQDLCMIPYIALPSNISLEDTQYAGFSSLLFQEYKAFFHFYMDFSKKDHRYCTTLMGTVPLKEEQIIQKLADELKLACVCAPALFHLEQEFSQLYEACKEAFLEDYPDKESFL